MVAEISLQGPSETHVDVGCLNLADTMFGSPVHNATHPVVLVSMLWEEETFY